MAKVSKNARTNRGDSSGKNMVKVIKAFRSKKTGAVAYKEAVVDKDHVKDFFKKEEAE